MQQWTAGSLLLSPDKISTSSPLTCQYSVLLVDGRLGGHRLVAVTAWPWHWQVAIKAGIFGVERACWFAVHDQWSPIKVGGG